jgi:peptidoglycan/xylan/chitin deacetylase (PgdA/CDA1 family)
LNHFLRHITAGLFHASGCYSLLRRLDARRGTRLIVLMYHDILDDDVAAVRVERGPRAWQESNHLSSPTASQFSAQVAVMARRFRLLRLSDAVDEMENGGLRQDSVAVTFDDGYASVHRNALPVLRRHGIPATLFVLTGLIDGLKFWWHDVRSIVARAPLDHLEDVPLSTILGCDLPAVRRDDRETLTGVIEDGIRDLPEASLNDAVARLADALQWDGVYAEAASPPLSWNQVRELDACGVELAAHTHSHINFAHADLETVQTEIRDSMRSLETRIGRPVVGFAYPYGKDIASYRGFLPLLRECGIRYACTAVPGNNRSPHDLLLLRRVTPPCTRSPALIEHALYRAYVRDDASDARSRTARAPEP